MGEYEFDENMMIRINEDDEEEEMSCQRERER